MFALRGTVVKLQKPNILSDLNSSEILTNIVQRFLDSTRMEVPLNKQQHTVSPLKLTLNQVEPLTES